MKTNELARAERQTKAMNELKARAEKAEARVAELEADLAQYSSEFGLPPTMRPANGVVTSLFRERDEAVAARDAAQRREAAMREALELLMPDDEQVAVAKNASDERKVTLVCLMGEIRKGLQALSADAGRDYIPRAVAVKLVNEAREACLAAMSPREITVDNEVRDEELTLDEAFDRVDALDLMALDAWKEATK